jgi:predicted aspartyl protease
MNTLFFDIPNEDDVIILDAVINDKNELLLALDTAATHTTLDSNMLYMFGFRLQDSKGQVQVETSNGIIISQKYIIKKLEVMGIVEYNFEVQVYDFIAHGITSNYDGVLGLDFLRKRKFCIDVPKGEISIQTIE